MESCANEGEEVLISVSKCFKCTCQVSCTYSLLWQLCGLFSFSLSLSVGSLPLFSFINLSLVSACNRLRAPALGCVPTEMTQYGRNIAKQFPCSSNKSCTVPPCPRTAVCGAACATPAMSSQDMHRGCAERNKRICCGCGHVSYISDISYTSQCLPDAARKCLYVS